MIPSVKKGNALRRTAVATAKPAPAPVQERAIYRVTRFSVAGSHLPVIFCQYKGRWHAVNGMQDGRVMGTDDGMVGTTSVQGGLINSDPALMLR